MWSLRLSSWAPRSSLCDGPLNPSHKASSCPNCWVSRWASPSKARRPTSSLLLDAPQAIRSSPVEDAVEKDEESGTEASCFL